ncbi:MAG: HAMP domain-containing histidine kinase, partial [Lachnospiraceae bacterium]|nr:HAMP domain-containing histidine kinase [Lachnospiraceae bacterium]
ISTGIALTGYALFFFVILFFSNKIIHPVTESYEKQKRFITDAGHEIKTPLTIIKADVDVLEMELGENEWLTDIQKQTKRLAALTNDLVYLSRMEEANDSMQMIEFPFSDVVSETTASFQALAQTQGKIFQCEIQPMLSLTGNEKAIYQLVNILLDNALKYSPNNGTVSLVLKKQSKTIQLSVFNTTENLIPKDKLNLLFERFYRIDSSHNSQTGGYGIGLSVAKAIVTAHNGKIQAKTEDGHSLQITATFPI